MKKSGKHLSLVPPIFALLVLISITACTVNEQGIQAAKKATEATVETQVGVVESYTGVVNPTLDANYLQSAEEAQRYGAEMQDIIENGLGVDRVLQSGI